MAYEDQLALKRERLRQALQPLGYTVPVDIVGLDDPWRYRHRAELTFGESDGRLALGYHAARSFWRIVDLDDCLLLPEPVTRVLRDVRDLAAGTGLPAYRPRTHEGFFRYVLVRASRAAGNILVCVITAPGPRDILVSLAQALVARHPEVSSVYWGVTDRIADVATPESLWLLSGAPYLEERIGPFRLQLHPLTFLQPSSGHADLMYERLCRDLEPRQGSVAWDLYSGVGVAALYLSRQFERVYAIDVEPHHLELAQRNAARNGVQQIEFRSGRVESLLLDRRFWIQQAKPDVVVVDPPRAGVHPHALSSILAARPRGLAYLSCNLQSLVRDLRVLLSGFPRYRLSAVQAFDLFAQTNHLEILALLQRSP